ncbi:unnamed protein product [Paramecium octaurelia]|uniref:Transmembrane protein n=1 Tax=Paramecium octaurelia TaxID=43137 RepID=A0A8S1T6Z5_PAROT|nr:unnamed protein product [Paramecium octaurelia]
MTLSNNLCHSYSNFSIKTQQLQKRELKNFSHCSQPSESINLSFLQMYYYLNFYFIYFPLVFVNYLLVISNQYSIYKLQILFILIFHNY